MLPAKQKTKIMIAYNKPPHQGSKEELDAISEAAVEGEARAVCAALTELGHTPQYLPVFHLEKDIEAVLRWQPQVIFNLCEGFRGNAHHEMHLAGLWELLRVPYTGNPPLTLGVAQNKVLSKRLFLNQGIPTPAFEVHERVPETCRLNYPLIAKPSCEDASVGITQDSIIDGPQQLQPVVGRLLEKYRQPILVEELIPGREFNISILGNRPPQVLPISEIDFSAVGEEHVAITSYEAKWLSQHPLYQRTPAVCPAEVDSPLLQRLHEVALKVYEVLGGRDYGRVDVRVTPGGEIFVLEYNPNPDISPDAGFPRSLAAAGISYHQFVYFLLKEASERFSNDSHSRAARA